MPILLAAAMLGASGTAAAAQASRVRALDPVRITALGSPAPLEAVVVRSTGDSLTVALLPDSLGSWPGVLSLSSSRLAAWPQRSYALSELRRLEVGSEVRRSMRRGAVSGALAGGVAGALLGWLVSDDAAGGAAVGGVALAYFGAVIQGTGAESRWPSHWRTIHAAGP